jgi:hypothetical protein
MLREPPIEVMEFGKYEKAKYEVYCADKWNTRKVYSCFTTIHSQKEMIEMLAVKYESLEGLLSIVIFKTDSDGKSEIYRKSLLPSKAVVFINTLTVYADYRQAAEHNGYQTINVFNSCNNKLMKNREFLFEADFNILFPNKSKHLTYFKP